VVILRAGVELKSGKHLVRKNTPILSLSQEFVRAGAPKAVNFQTQGLLLQAGRDLVNYVGHVPSHRYHHDRLPGFEFSHGFTGNGCGGLATDRQADTWDLVRLLLEAAQPG
jgi:hypothetical protein